MTRTEIRRALAERKISSGETGRVNRVDVRADAELPT
jgi:hypothetical protein